MKKPFKILACCLCSIVLLNMSLHAKADGNDSYDPPILPGGGSAAVFCATSALEVLFFDEADVIIEVVAENGSTIYLTNGAVDKDSQVCINAKSWKKGKYTVRVRMNGQLVEQKSVCID